MDWEWMVKAGLTADWGAASMQLPRAALDLFFIKKKNRWDLYTTSVLLYEYGSSP